MGLSERIQQDLVAAMRERAELRLSTLRMMKAAIKNREIEARRPLEEAEVQQVLGTLIKQREDSAAQFLAGGRAELAAKEKEEIGIIETYLPRALSAEEVEATVRAAIAECGASSAKDMGKAMKAAMARFQAAQQRVDGKQVSEAVKRLLPSA
ncbi:MAG TPA: GatB/YqeY domain-containing protein [Terriglobales bacterium]|nr:GatB/YqeY domain-containing protein [Terriglobales bacterium]